MAMLYRLHEASMKAVNYTEASSLIPRDQVKSGTAVCAGSNWMAVFGSGMCDGDRCGDVLFI
jgi:hypothetical protein